MNNSKLAFISFIALLFLAACSENNYNNEKPETATVGYIKVSVEDQAITRTLLGNGYALSWSSNDNIGLYSDVQDVEQYVLDGTPQGGNAIFKGNTVSGSKFYAFFPYNNDSYNQANRTVLRAYLNGGWVEGQNLTVPLVAVSTNNVFDFKQVSGAIRISLKGKDKIKQIVLQGNNDEYISGEGTIDMSSSQPEFVINTANANKFSYCTVWDFLNQETPKSYFFPVPNMTFDKGITLRIEGIKSDTNEDFVLEKKTTSPLVVGRARMKNFNEVLDTDAMLLIEETVPVTDVSLNKTSLELNVGDEYSLTAIVVPDNATNNDVEWSTNSSAVTVSPSGMVSAVSPGAATVTVKTSDGGKTATCSVTVKAVTVSVTGVSLNKPSLELTVGGSETLTATVTPNEATNKNVTWSSSSTSIAKVEDGKVTAVAPGTATITVKTVDGEKTATCTVLVKSDNLDGDFEGFTGNNHNW